MIDSFNTCERGGGNKRRKLEGIYFNTDEKAQLASLMPRLKKEHDKLVNYKPLFGNDTIKEFLKEFIEFVTFNNSLQYNVSINTAANKQQQVYLSAKATSEEDTVRSRVIQMW